MKLSIKFPKYKNNKMQLKLIENYPIILTTTEYFFKIIL